MAEELNIPLNDRKFNTMEVKASENLVKRLCSKDIVDPFDVLEFLALSLFIAFTNFIVF